VQELFPSSSKIPNGDLLSWVG